MIERTGRPAHAWLWGIVLLSQAFWANSSEENFSSDTTALTLLISLRSAEESDASSDRFSYKKYAYAHDDAAAYVASEGRIHGAQLERAWRDHRLSRPDSRIGRDTFAVGVLAWSTE